MDALCCKGQFGPYIARTVQSLKRATTVFIPSGASLASKITVQLCQTCKCMVHVSQEVLQVSTMIAGHWRAVSYHLFGADRRPQQVLTVSASSPHLIPFSLGSEKGCAKSRHGV